LPENEQLRTLPHRSNPAASTLIWQQFLPEMRRGVEPLQDQIRNSLIRAILDGRIRPGTKLPSSRELALLLRVARKTIVLACKQLVESGYIVSRPRSGFFVAQSVPASRPDDAPTASPRSSHDWSAGLALEPHGQKWLEKPHNWQQFEYAFVYGQFDPTLFPANEWRECSRMVLDTAEIYDWAADAIDTDDPMLVEQLRTRVLPRRGIAAKPDEILVTMGAQHALFLLGDLLIAPGTVVAVEDPGYMDARNILIRRKARIVGVPVDEYGLDVSSAGGLARCEYLYCTPSHHCPTGVTMTTERRLALLSEATRHEFVIIEDDYDAETQYVGQPLPALKAMDRYDCVLYIGSLSKTLFPGLRIGYLVGPKEVIAQARQLRRLMIRHPPANNQRALAFFIARGHYDRLLARTRSSLIARAEATTSAVRAFLPDFEFRQPTGGSALWLEGPEGLDLSRVEAEAHRDGVLIECGSPFFCTSAPTNFVRLAYSSIRFDRINPGIERLAKTVRRMLSEKAEALIL
jgi:GntR family transcriptional regulator / MocR family aminotransferase